jgi:hypothetical protein
MDTAQPIDNGTIGALEHLLANPDVRLELVLLFIIVLLLLLYLLRERNRGKKQEGETKTAGDSMSVIKELASVIGDNNELAAEQNKQLIDVLRQGVEADRKITDGLTSIASLTVQQAEQIQSKLDALPAATTTKLMEQLKPSLELLSTIRNELATIVQTESNVLARLNAVENHIARIIDKALRDTSEFSKVTGDGE